MSECVCNTDTTYKCARRDCDNTWTAKANCFHCHPVICGFGSSVCPPCSTQGYVAQSGTGGPITTIYKDGKVVDEFDPFKHHLPAEERIW